MQMDFFLNVNYFCKPDIHWGGIHHLKRFSSNVEMNENQWRTRKSFLTLRKTSAPQFFLRHLLRRVEGIRIFGFVCCIDWKDFVLYKYTWPDIIQTVASAFPSKNQQEITLQTAAMFDETTRYINSQGDKWYYLQLYTISWNVKMKWFCLINNSEFFFWLSPYTLKCSLFTSNLKYWLLTLRKMSPRLQ